ncbi:transmembrane protein 183 [Toxorhynchites rutilus septentrionalis]|uniref:transmembrane protein 183 n=1 Tax=Toxorhynchites rutilus septentrionalis TaxID=329112 RepID=UPI00247B0FDB|nr:transmembrane protein 183 [Toxorhynchites rutilus septentrionalis]
MSGMSVCVKVKSRNSSSANDVTIYDFANSLKTGARFSKANKLAICTVTDEEADDETPDNGSRKITEDLTARDTLYADYVIDIWYLISEYIHPEDIARFALICRKTAEVVQSAKFWKHLYWKHYSHNIELPRRLQPEFMVLQRGLRARTIRSLFYFYTPFINRITATSFTDPHRVEGRQMIYSWYSKNKTGWNYYFKLRTRLITGSRAAKSAMLQRSKDSLEYLQDTYMNPEEGCQILIVITDSIHIIPQFHEQLYVKSITQTLAQGMTKYKVRLQLANYCQRVVDELTFVPVRQVRVLDWWNPEYYREDSTISERDLISEEHEDEMSNEYWDD